MKIRAAIKNEAGSLTKIAHDAKRHWGYPELWIQHWQDDLTISEDYIATHQVFLAEEEDRILGFYALIVQGEKAELDHMWVAPEHIGSGVGKALFLHAMQIAANQSLAGVEILSDPNAAGFYRKMGAFEVGTAASETPDKSGPPRMLPRLEVDPGSVA